MCAENQFYQESDVAGRTNRMAETVEELKQEIEDRFAALSDEDKDSLLVIGHKNFAGLVR